MSNAWREGFGSVSIWRVLCVVAALAVLTTGRAEAYSPWNDWRTLVTPHFRIHYPVGYYEDALRFGRAAEQTFEILVRRLGWRPDAPIDIVLNDDTDLANGFARAVPYSLVGVNAVAPGALSVLNDYDDWRYLLIAHELTHIIHTDTIRGLPALLNMFLGRQFVPNGVLPRWLLEGMAVYFESTLTSAGRLRSSLFDMMLRMHTLEHRAMDLGEITGFPQRWPQGTTPYLYGGHFVEFLVDDFGEEILPALNNDYGYQVIPFGVDFTAEKTIGETYSDLYSRFIAERYREDRAVLSELERQGRIEGERVTFTAQLTGPARYAPNGDLYYAVQPLNDRSAIRRFIEDDDDQRIAFVETDADLAFDPGGQSIIASFADINSYYRIFQDLYRIDLKSGSRTQLTHGARASSPDVSTDGKLVFVQQSGGHSVLRYGDLENPNQARVLLDLGDNTQIYNPRFIDDETAIVFAAHRNGQHDLYRVELDDGSYRALTSDRFIDGAPMPDASGRYVFFHSDRDGIYNIYVMPSSGGALRRVTRVLGGAFRPAPSPDGKKLAYQSYSAEGFDVSILPLTGELSELPLAEAYESERPEVVETPELTVYPVEEYSVWPSILPRAWLPVAGTDTQGTTLGLAVSGIDAAEEHLYVLQLTQGLVSNYTSFFAQYANQMFHPGVSLSVSRSLRFANVVFEGVAPDTALEESLWSGSASVSLPLWSRLDNSGSLFVSYLLEYRNSRDESRSVLANTGRFASLVVGANVSNVRGFTNSISPEEGASLEITAQVEDPSTGSEFKSFRATAIARAYLSNPLFDRHVLALEAFGGYGYSNYDERRLFGIAGLPTTDLVLDLFGLNLSSARALRGFPLIPIAGDALVEGHVEYRFPVWDIQAGIDTLPVYIGNLSAAPFVDMAGVADDIDEVFDVGNRFMSAGAELRLDIVLGYGLATSLRGGYGRALLGGDTQAGYIVFGASF